MCCVAIAVPLLRCYLCVLVLPTEYVCCPFPVQAWVEKFESYLESGEAPGKLGSLFRDRYIWW